MPGESLTPSETSDFVVRIIQDVEWRSRDGRRQVVLTYPKAEIRALGSARTLLESMIERRRGFNVGKLEDGIKAIAEIRTSAKAIGEEISIAVSIAAAACLGACMPYFIEYEVLWEKDRTDIGRRWRK